MKKSKFFTVMAAVSVLFFFIISAQIAAGQQAEKTASAIPGNLNKIFSNSCTPCHTSKGPKMAQFMVNFEDWTKNTPEKASQKAEKIYSMLSKDKMPPKSARENRPDIVLTKDQVELVKKWADSLKEVKK